MCSDVATGEHGAPDSGNGTGRAVRVALGRRVEVIGDLLLPPEPSSSSLAACSDIGRRLEEWQGPGIVILCGRLAAPSCAPDEGVTALANHPVLVGALRAFAGRPDSRILAVVGSDERDDAVEEELTRCGVEVRESVDLHCETGAGTRTVLVRAGSLRPDANPPIDATPTEDRPWLAGIERLDDPLLTRRFVTSRLLYRRLRRFLWAPPLVLAAVALLLRVEFVVDGLGHVFRSPRQQNALQRRLRRLVVLALRRHADHRRPPPDRPGRRGRRHVPRHLARARRRRPAGAVGRRRVGDPPHRPQPAPDRRGGRARHHPRRRRGRGVGRHRRRRAGARAHPPRRGLLRLPGRHLGGGPRAPGPAGAAAHVPAPSAGGDARDRDRRRPPRPPAAGRGRSPHGDHGRATGHGRRRHQGPLQGGRGARRAGGFVAERRVVAARARGGGRPHQRAAHPPPGRRLPVRRRRDRPALLGDRTAAGPPAPHCAVPPGHRGPGRRGPGGHRRHRHDHVVARHPARAATFVDRGRRPPRARRWRCTSSTPPTSSPWSCVPAC